MKMTSIFNQASFDFTNVRSRKLVFKIDQFLSGIFDRGHLVSISPHLFFLRNEMFLSSDTITSYLYFLVASPGPNSESHSILVNFFKMSEKLSEIVAMALLLQVSNRE